MLQVLSRGSVTSFIMDVSESLGDISYLRIWHDNSGQAENADWFFKMMVVKDMQTGKRSVQSVSTLGEIKLVRSENLLKGYLLQQLIFH